MITTSRGHYLCEVLSRTRQLSSGLWLADKLQEEKKDNVARCLGVGGPTIKECHLCHERRYCKKKCAGKGKLLPIIAKRADIIHFKNVFGQKFTYEDKRYISLTHDDIIAVENDTGDIKAVGSMVIAKLIYTEKSGSIFIPQGAVQQNQGEFKGKIISIGLDFPDKNLKIGDDIIYLRGEGYRFISYLDRQENYSIKSQWCYGKIDNLFEG